MTIKMVQIPVVRKTTPEAAFLNDSKGKTAEINDRFKQVQDQELDAMDRYIALGYQVIGAPVIISDGRADDLVYILWVDGPPQPHAR